MTVPAKYEGSLDEDLILGFMKNASLKKSQTISAKIKLIIDVTGHVSTAVIIRSSGNNKFDDALIISAKELRPFVPAMLGHELASMEMEIPLIVMSNK
jgi:TonB family protein